MRSVQPRPVRRKWNQRGLTLIETMIAAVILLIVSVSLLSMFTAAVLQTQKQGDYATRCTEYAQDKMEQLLALQFNDGTTDTTVFPVNPVGCTGLAGNICGLGGTMAGSSTAGPTNIGSSAPVAKYVDYFDPNGGYLGGTSTGSVYTRQWQIVTDSTANLKTITVLVTSNVPGTTGAAPSATLVTIKANNL